MRVNGHSQEILKGRQKIAHEFKIEVLPGPNRQKVKKNDDFNQTTQNMDTFFV